MHTTCPHCSSVFRITAEQLALAGGKVRCGYCQSVFNALSTLEEDWKEKIREDDSRIADITQPEEPATASAPEDVYNNDIELPVDDIIDSDTAAEDEADAITASQPSIAAQAEALFAELKGNIENTRQQSAQTDKQNTVPESEPAPKPDTAQTDESETGRWAGDWVQEQPRNEQQDNNAEADVAPTPSQATTADTPKMEPPEAIREYLAEVTSGKHRSYTGWWLFGILLMAVALTAQLAYLFRDTLAQHDQLRKPLLMMCEVMSCEIPLINDIERGKKTLTMVSHSISKIPDKPDQLRIQAVFTNTARYRQAYPVLSIKLSNDNGDITAMRRFRPEEYLTGTIDLKKGLPARTAIEVILDINKPSAPVESYQFDFL